MKTSLQHIKLKNFKLQSGKILDLNLSYQIFGKSLFSAPVIVVNHALTGNSNVSGNEGWWNDLVGENKVINTLKFTVLCFNIPGNGYDGTLMKDDVDFIVKDIAGIFLEGLEQLKITELYIIIGPSLGGAIGWEMLAIKPGITRNLIAIACDYMTSDWLYSQCEVQKFLLDHAEKPLQKARMHAMLCYRTPESLNGRFKGELVGENGIPKSLDWLNFHGKALQKRFTIGAYRRMNSLLMSINSDLERIKSSTADLHLIAVDSDLFFPAFEMRNCREKLVEAKKNTFYHEIKSIHGHDAFLIEYQQLNDILDKII